MFKYTNLSSREQKRYFVSLSAKEKLTTAIDIVSRFINTEQFTQEITNTTYNVIKAAEYILDRQAKGKNSYTNLVISYNVVMSLINNNYKDYLEFTKLFKTKIIEKDGNLILGDFIIKTTDNEKLFSNNPNDLFWIFENNQLYLILSKQHSVNNDLDEVISLNKFNDSSVKIPLIHKNNITVPVLNGKDWVKHYTLKNSTGFLYYIKAKIKNQIFYKVGISVSKERFKYKNVELLESKFLEMDMLSAAIIEQYIHLSNPDRRLFIGDIDNDFAGKNECYHIDLYDKYKNININNCLDIICEHKGYDKTIIQYALTKI